MEITSQTTLLLERSRAFKESPPGRFPEDSSDPLQVQGRVPGPPRWEPFSQVSLLPHQPVSHVPPPVTASRADVSDAVVKLTPSPS